MKIKNAIILLLLIWIFPASFYSQDTINYFEQEPPGDIPQKFAADIISVSERIEVNPVFSPDGKEFYFTSHDPITYENTKIWMAKYTDGEWDTPVNINLTGKKYNWGVCFSPDCRTIFINANDSWTFDIWYCTRTETGWSSAMKISDEVNSIGSEIAHSMSSDSIIYFRSTGKDTYGSEDIYYSKLNNGSFDTYVHMKPPINSKQKDFNPIISPDNKYMIIHTERPGTNGMSVSFRKGETWTNPKLLPGFIVNDGAFSGSITPDGKYLLFGRNNEIYWVALENIVDSLRNTNFTPYLYSNIPDLSAKTNSEFNYTIPDSIFIDDDGNETLTLTAELDDGNDLPDSLYFNSTTKILKSLIKKTGSYSIKIIATDTAGASVSDVFTLTVEQGITGINETFLHDNITVYPNPTNNTLQIDYLELQQKDSYYRIIDLSGKIIQEGIIIGGKINTSRINKGIYFLKFEINREIINKKILLQ